MLQPCFDESGRGHGAKFVLAGYLATADEWMAFSDEWQTCLDKEPKLAYVKGSEAFGLRGEFMRWSTGDRDARLLEFVPLIESYSGKGFILEIDQAAFAQIIKVAKDSPFKNPDRLAWFLALSTFLSIAQHDFPSELIDLVFDQDVVRRAGAESGYKMLFDQAPELAKILARREPHFEDDKKFRPLQAADLLAHCANFSANPDVVYDRVRHSPVLPALRAIKTAIVHINGDPMRYMADRVEKNIPRRSDAWRAERWLGEPTVS